MKNNPSVTLAITGASGVCYALKLLQQLLQRDLDVHLMISDAAKVVFATEMEMKIPNHNESLIRLLREKVQVLQLGKLMVYGKNDWMSVVASGSSCPDKMIVCPCSTGTLSAIACGASDNLIERAADVMLKEKKQLILVIRETPYSSIHLRNMQLLSDIGVTIMPASPGFYHNPKSIDDLIDFVVARILTHLGFEQKIINCWGY